MPLRLRGNLTNGPLEPTALRIGQQLRIPAGESTTVHLPTPVTGDTLTSTGDHTIPTDEPVVTETPAPPSETAAGPAPGTLPAAPGGFDLPAPDQMPPPLDQPQQPQPATEVPATTPLPGAETPVPATPATPIQVADPSTPQVPLATPPAPDLDTINAAHDTDNGIDTTAVAGLGAIAAVAILGGLAFRRRRQQHDRRRGERIALPTGAAADTEAALNIGADPETLAKIDAALRHLTDHCRTTEQPLPRLLGVFVLPDAVELAIIDDHVDLPTPWSRTDDGAWSIALTARLAPPETAVAPYPALVHLGTTTDGNPVLINLEELGHLAIVTPHSDATSLIRALTVFLATSPLADQLTLTVTGGQADDLVDALDLPHVNHTDTADTVLDALARHTRTDVATLQDEHIDSVGQARAVYRDSDMTAPHIVILGDPLTTHQQEALDEILDQTPRIAFAAVSATMEPAADWILDVDDTGTATLKRADADAGFTIIPAALPDADYTDLVELLTTANQPAIAAHPDIDADDYSAAVVDAKIVDADTVEDLPGRVPVVTMVPTVDDNPITTDDLDTSEDPITAEETADQAPEATEPTTTDTDPAVSTPALAPPAKTSDTPHPEIGHIWIHLLGTPKVTPLSGAPAEKGRETASTELAALLSTHPGLLYGQLDAKMWPHGGDKTPKAASDRRQTAFRLLRKWLGDTSTGELAFPRHGDRTGATGYKLHPEVRSDWDIWQQLIPGSPTHATTENLAAAAELVTGRPFADAPPSKYSWAVYLQEEMTSVVADALEELASRYIEAGDTIRASAIAEKGLDVDPSRECLWRLALIASHHRDTDKTQALLTDMIANFDDLDVTEYEPETDQLLTHLAHYHDHTGRTPYKVGIAS